MYRKESYQRIFSQIHKLRQKRNTTSDFYALIELNSRIQNLKNIIAITTSTY